MIETRAQEPPQDRRIFNRRQKDGTFRPTSQFFDTAIELAKHNTVDLRSRAQARGN